MAGDDQPGGGQHLGPPGQLVGQGVGKIVSAFVKRGGSVAPEDLDRFCRSSGLAAFKRPRRYVFVAAIPKSPVGKLLRRKLVAGEYEPEQGAADRPQPETAA